jgi:hypothetical protein
MKVVATSSGVTVARGTLPPQNVGQ